MNKQSKAVDYSARARKAWDTRRKMAKDPNAKKAKQDPNAKSKKKSSHQKN